MYIYIRIVPLQFNVFCFWAVKSRELDNPLVLEIYNCWFPSHVEKNDNTISD